MQAEIPGVRRSGWRYGGATMLLAVVAVTAHAALRAWGAPEAGGLLLTGLSAAALLFGPGPGLWAAILAFAAVVTFAAPAYRLGIVAPTQIAALALVLAAATAFGLLLRRGLPH